MINRLNIITVIFLCCFISGTSAYFTIKVGGGIVHDVSDAVDNTQFTVKHNPAFKIYFAGGWELTRTKRLEIEWGLTGLDAKKIKYTVGGKDFSIDVEDRAVGMIGKFMINVYHDFISKSRWRPNLGLGIGFTPAEHKYTKNKDYEEDIVNLFGYQFMAGYNYKISNDTLFLVQYMFLGTTKGRFSKTTDGKNLEDSIYIHSLNLGFTFFA